VTILYGLAIIAAALVGCGLAQIAIYLVEENLPYGLQVPALVIATLALVFAFAYFVQHAS
jgi:hypothetical protein